VSADLISGGTMVAALVVALFFFRYWRQTRDRLFLIFSAGFLIFAVSRLVLAILDEAAEGRVFVYALRLLAFALILVAIIDKNRSPDPQMRGASSNGDRPNVGVTGGRSPARR
jgi:drug/metabolite transporter superfamily protein YnfA